MRTAANESIHKICSFRRSPRRHKHDTAPVILMPNSNSPHLDPASAGCVPSHKVSSIGFLAFVVSVVNGVISATNNMNNNNNNNNNNDNNQNNVNVNIANLNNDQSSSSSVTVPGVGRKLPPLDAFDGGVPGRRVIRGAGANRVAVLHAAAGEAATSIVALWFRTLGTDNAARLERMFCEAGQKYAVWGESDDGDTAVWVTKTVFEVLLDAASHELSQIKVGVRESALQTVFRRGMVDQCI